MGLLFIPVLSYSFGLFGKIRSGFANQIALNELGANPSFLNSKINHFHYMTYVYISSPLANLQKNINEENAHLNDKDIKKFVFYSLIPESLTSRLSKTLKLTPPACHLITPELIAGTVFMTGFYTMGWPGMIFMLFYIIIASFICLLIISKWKAFSITTFSILSTTVTLLVFDNLLLRMDVILMLFIHPLIFHFIFKKTI